MAEYEVGYTPQSGIKDKALAAETQPDISPTTCVALKLSNKTIIYVPHWKIKKYGEAYFIKKYNKVKR